jgi:glycosyltransferase involved in cell wall biosynthesis
MLLSLIIPCYNSSATIRRCLDSIYALPLEESEFEVIIVDDASTDGTGSMVGDYGKAHANLTLIRHLVNRNLGAARNTGLVAAKGDYIAFVDSDDEVAPGVLSALKMMEERELDMVAMREDRLSETGELIKTWSLPYAYAEVFQGTRLMTEHPYWRTTVWSYLYRRSFLEKVQYPFVEGLYYEDSDYVNRHLYHASRMSYCDDLSYRQHRTPGSIVNTFSFKTLTGYILMGTRMLSLYAHVEDKMQHYAHSILEGGMYNISVGFRKMMLLSTVNEIRTVYNVLDAHVDRKSVLSSAESIRRWPIWTHVCLKHRYIATFIAGTVVSVPMLKRILRRLK